MNIIQSLAIRLAVLFLLIAFSAAETSGKTLRIFVLTGQSNSLGTPATTETNMILPLVQSYSADTNVPFFWDNTADNTPAGDAALGDSGGQWTNICLQTGGYYTYSTNHWGPEVGCARMLWDIGYRDFGIVKSSRGGGGNSYWCKTNADHYMYSKVLNTVSNAALVLPSGYTNLQVVCLLYLQGESDSTYEASIADQRFFMLLTNLQTDLTNAVNMKAVFGEIASDTSGNRLTVSQKQSALAASRADIGYAQSAGLSLQTVDGLNLHYNADSLVIMGERMAQEALLAGALPESVLPAQTNLYAWYRGDHGVVPTASATVARWDDMTTGASSRDLTQIVGAPTMIAGAFAGLPHKNFIRFDGASQAVWCPSATFGFATNPRSLFFALRVNGSGDGFLFDGSTSTGMTRAQVRTNFWQAGLQPTPIGNAPNADPVTAPRATGVWQFHEFDYIPTNGATLVRHWINGTNAAVYTNSNLNGLGGLILAANAQAQRLLAVDIAELMIYTNDLSASNRAAVLSYLQSNWTPTVVPPDASDIYAWFTGDAGLSVGADNYSVTSWANYGTAATNATYTQAGRNLSSLTGSPQKIYLRSPGGATMGAVTFDGTDGIWMAKGNFGIITNNRTVIAYARVRNAATTGFLFDGTSSTPGFTRALVSAGNWQVSANSGTGSITAPARTNEWQVHTFIVSTNTSTSTFSHYTNGLLAGSVAVGLPGYLSGLMIGANYAQAGGIKADVAEFLVFNSALDDTTRTNVENYLSAKWSGVVADPNPPAAPPPYDYFPLFVNGTGYPVYRIPALITTTNGTVIAVADGRQSQADVPGFTDCVARRSFDNGYTWGPLQVITDYGTSTNVDNVDTWPAYGITNLWRRRSASDPALLLDHTNGRVWVMYDNGTTNGGGRAIKLEMKYSDDDGATWSPRIDVEALNPGLRPPRASGPELLCGPGNGIQLAYGTHAGRLIFPVYVYGNPYYSTIIYSDDHGATWQRGGTAGTGGGEIQVVETPGGGLLASMRDNNFSWSGMRTFSRSADGGHTWGALFTNTTNPPTIPDPACQGSILRFSSTNEGSISRLVLANCASSSSRMAMTLRVSYDEGATWPVSNLVYAASSGYSAITRMANGKIGLLNEVNGITRIDFVQRSLGEITGGSDTNLLGPTGLLNLNCLPPLGTNPPALAFTALTSNTYTIQYRDSLATGAWLRLADIAGPPTSTIVQIPLSGTTDFRFYRLLTPQLP